MCLYIWKNRFISFFSRLAFNYSGLNETARRFTSVSPFQNACFIFVFKHLGCFIADKLIRRCFAFKNRHLLTSRDKKRDYRASSAIFNACINITIL